MNYRYRLVSEAPAPALHKWETEPMLNGMTTSVLQGDAKRSKSWHKSLMIM